MSVRKLSCKTIGELDNGLAERLINAELAKITGDLDDRGHDGVERKLVIELAFKKEVKRAGETVGVDVKVQAKLPPLRSGFTTSKVGVAQHSGEMSILFRDDNASNPDQPTFDDMAAREAE